MRTPTLIVRLVGLYLLVTCVYSLYSLAQVPIPEAGTASRQVLSVNNAVSVPGPDAGAVFQYVQRVKYLHAFGACAGLVVARFAGWFARILTFDAEPRPSDSSDPA